MSMVWGTPSFWGGESHHKEFNSQSRGVHLDLALTMETQVAALVCATYFHLQRISQLHSYLDVGALTTLFHVLVVSRLD